MIDFSHGWELEDGDMLLLTNGCKVFRGIVSDVRKAEYGDGSYFNIGSGWEFSTNSPSLPHHVGFVYTLGKLTSSDTVESLSKNNANFIPLIIK